MAMYFVLLLPMPRLPVEEIELVGGRTGSSSIVDSVRCGGLDGRPPEEDRRDLAGRIRSDGIARPNRSVRAPVVQSPWPIADDVRDSHDQVRECAFRRSDQPCPRAGFRD